MDDGNNTAAQKIRNEERTWLVILFTSVLSHCDFLCLVENKENFDLLTENCNNNQWDHGKITDLCLRGGKMGFQKLGHYAHNGCHIKATKFWCVKISSL